MTISSGDRRVIEGEIGPIHPDDETLIDGYLDDLGVAELAALQWLKRRLGEISTDAMDIGAAGASLGYVDTAKAIKTHMRELAETILASDTISLAGDGEILVSNVLATSAVTTTTIPTTVASRRRS